MYYIRSIVKYLPRSQLVLTSLDTSILLVHCQQNMKQEPILPLRSQALSNLVKLEN